MATDTSEKNLKIILVSHLRDNQGYDEVVSNNNNTDYALDYESLNRFREKFPAWKDADKFYLGKIKCITDLRSVWHNTKQRILVKFAVK